MNKNKISRKSRKRNRQIKNSSRKRKQAFKRLSRAIVIPLKINFGKTIQNIISKTPYKIKVKIEEQEGCEPEFN